jgi:hypothetical protein
MRVVGFSGKIGTGKSKAAEILVLSYLPGVAIRVAFGDLLKAEVADAFGFPRGMCYDQRAKHSFMVPTFQFPGAPKPKMALRELLQWYGTEYRRKQDPGYWVRAMELEIARLRGLGYGLVVIDDVRFEDEAEMVLAHGGFLYRLQPYLGWKPGPYAGHSSETALDEFHGFTAWLHPGFGALADVVDRVRADVALGRPNKGGFLS